MRFKKMTAVLLCTLLAGCSVQPENTEKELVKYSNISLDAGFDTLFEQTEFGYDRDAMEKRFDNSVSIFARCNDLFDIYNLYKGTNNLKTVNDNAGIAPVEVDETVIEMLRCARQFYDLSNGEFDITMGALLQVWHRYREEGILLNYEEKTAPVPSYEELAEAKKHSGWDKVIIDEENNTVYLSDPEMSLDVGGIAKGYAAEMIGQSMDIDEVVYATVNAGRNIRTVHSKADGSPWNIAIMDPAGETSICLVQMDGSGSFVTSGDYERYYIGEDGKRYHHIIDPATLYPADYYHSVSVVTPDSGAADCLSTTLFTMSIEDGKKVIEQYKALSGNPCEAVWIMDPERSQDCEGIEVSPYFAVYTEGLEGRITWARS